MFLLFFDAIPRHERTSVLTTFNLGNSLATAVGSLLGGLILAWGGKSPGTYLLLFGLSSVARGFTLFALAQRAGHASRHAGARTAHARRERRRQRDGTADSLQHGARSSRECGGLIAPS